MAVPKFKRQVLLLKLSVGENVTCYDLATQKVSRFRKLSSYQPWLEDSFLVPFLTALKRVLRLTRLASLLAGICSAQIWPIVRFKRRLTWKWEKRKYPEKNTTPPNIQQMSLNTHWNLSGADKSMLIGECQKTHPCPLELTASIFLNLSWQYNTTHSCGKKK